MGPIGIFDSGIGGLTVARAASDLLPNESILYFGDTAHLPYGEKSPELIRKYSTRIALHLLNSGCKAIVVACNSASSNALEQVREAVGENIPVIDMVHPVVESLYVSDAVPSLGCKKVGLIGTRATISSELYKRAIESLNNAANGTVELFSRATPLLASAIEEGFYNDTIPGQVLEAYLEDGYFNEVDSIILGCTHYPLVSEEVKDLLPKSVAVINSPKIVALALKKVLSERGLLLGKSSQLETSNKFQVSDLTENFRLGAERFFGGNISLDEVDLTL
ncbi:MAG: glutamate racemase [Crocinitomicaceae bacterium]|nr:glutamate racemase [Crocinitomicaceae bacterium]